VKYRSDEPTVPVHVPALRPGIIDHGAELKRIVRFPPVVQELERLRRQKTDDDITRPLRKV
jgi:hypothetical protein